MLASEKIKWLFIKRIYTSVECPDPSLGMVSQTPLSTPLMAIEAAVSLSYSLDEFLSPPPIDSCSQIALGSRFIWLLNPDPPLGLWRGASSNRAPLTGEFLLAFSWTCCGKPPEGMWLCAPKVGPEFTPWIQFVGLNCSPFITTTGLLVLGFRLKGRSWSNWRGTASLFGTWLSDKGGSLPFGRISPELEMLSLAVVIAVVGVVWIPTWIGVESLLVIVVLVVVAFELDQLGKFRTRGWFFSESTWINLVGDCDQACVGRGHNRVSPSHVIFMVCNIETCP